MSRARAAFPARRLWWGALAVAVIVPFLLPIPEAWQHRHVLRTLGTQYHVVIPFFLTLLLLGWRRLAPRPWLAAALVAGLTFAIELLQPRVGRHARWQDFALDLAGIGLALCWRARRGRRSRTALVAGILIIAGVLYNIHTLPGWILAERLAASRFPLLSDFETSRERKAWSHNDDGRYWIKEIGDGEGRCLAIASAGAAKYPGAILRGFPRDWSGYEVLEWRSRTAAGEGAHELTLSIRLDDLRGAGDDAFAFRSVRVGPEWRTHGIPLAELTTTAGRPLELAAVISLLFYVHQPQDTGQVWIDDIRLR